LSDRRSDRHQNGFLSGPSIRRHRPTTAFLVPTHLQRILQCDDLDADEVFDSLRLVAHAGAPCPESLKRATMERLLPGRLWEFYGSTEAQFTVCSPDQWLEHPGTVGRARAGRTLSIDDGVIWSTMPDFARFSYWRDEEATRRAWRGGACSIGDLGTLSDDGFLYLTGRRHDLIISGGVNVYPAEVENVLAAVDGVAEVAVFGLPEVKRGLFAAGGGIQLGRRVPIAVAMELALTGDTIDAGRAATMGLVNAVVAPERVLDEAIGLAERIAANGPLGIAATKRLMLAAFNDGGAAGWDLQKDLQPVVFGSEDAKEGALAFIERRPAAWKGR